MPYEHTLRADNQVNLSAMIGYQFAFGRTAPLPPGIGVFGGGSAAQVRTFDQGTARYRLAFFVHAFNLANHPNYLGYSGTMQSPFYLAPTAQLPSFPPPLKLRWTRRSLGEGGRVASLAALARYRAFSIPICVAASGRDPCADWP